ncbi:MAG: 5-oxoprolinase/urea amidolyase family protein [Acidimicrobiales bacterium]
MEQGGLQTTVQDTGGRLGYWMVGVPPSGAMDSLSLRLANRIVGNTAGAAGLECTVTGPTVRFERATVVALAGGAMTATLDGRPVPFWEPVPVDAGAVLALGSLVGPGMRTYLAVGGGIDVPSVLGSRATFTLGGFGGHQGRRLTTGDRLPFGDAVDPGLTPFGLRPQAIPAITGDWEVAVTEGPHAAPEFLTVEGVADLLAAAWTVQRHASRTGIRLSGPTPAWARADGGEAGLHPSNIHDTGYAFGAVDFTGDTPVVLGPDGPSLGGFTCPFTVISADRWKLGQLAPGDRLRFRLVDDDGAARIRSYHDRVVAHLGAVSSPRTAPAPPSRLDGGVMATCPGTPTDPPAVSGRPPVAIRRAGDEFILVEFGAMTLDLRLRAWAHALGAALDGPRGSRIDGIVDVTEGVRSVLVHVDPSRLRVPTAVGLLADLVDTLSPPGGATIASRTVHLPLSWEDPSTLEAIARYTQMVRPDAPWCPSNIEFIRRINGLDSTDEVRSIVFDASYLVLGLGDVYLGAPVATPLDPRHRLVTTKYNPARTWTPQNAVGIGGAYLCVYGMEGPGGYQFVGRTVPVWYLDQPTPGPEPEVPWLLRPFDQLRFHPVTAEELADLRADARAGRLDITIEPATFSLTDYEAWLDDHTDSIAAFRDRQQRAFAQERARWRAGGELT